MASSTSGSQKTARAASRSWADIAAGRKEAGKLEEQIPTDIASQVSAEQPSDEAVLAQVMPAAAAIHEVSEIVSQPLDTKKDDEDALPCKREPLRKYLNTLTDSTASTTMAESSAVLRPGARGSWKCFCFGEVVMMCGSYGWLAVHGEVDHPDADMHEGHIYVHKRDIAEGEHLEEGDPVSFYLYADKRGLGAEYCSPHVSVRQYTEIESEQSISTWAFGGTVFSADAIEFVPSWTDVQQNSFRANAPEFVLTTCIVSSDDVHEHDGDLQTDASVFSPSGFNQDAPEFVPCEVRSDTSSSDSDSGCEADDETADCLACEANSVCSESTSEHSLANHVVDVAVWDEDMEVVVMTAPLRRCTSHDSHEDTSSTCDGEVSGSDVGSDMMIKTSVGWIRPPPGLSIFG